MSASKPNPAELEGDRRAALIAGADLRGADLAASVLVDVELRGADLRGADLRGATLLRVDLRGARLDEARLDRALLVDCPADAGVARLAPPASEHLLPADPEARQRAVLELGAAIAALEDPAAAPSPTLEEHIDRAARAAPRWPRPWWAAGALWLRRGDPDTAAWAFEQAVHRDPADLFAALQASSIHLQRGRPRQSVAILAPLRHDPRLASHQRRLIHHHLVVALRDAGRPQDARVLAQEALEAWPDDAELRIRAAEVAWRLGDPGAALAHLRAALDAEPERTELALYLAELCLDALQMPSDALPLLQRRLEERPDDPHARELRLRAAQQLLALGIASPAQPPPASPEQAERWLLERIGAAGGPAPLHPNTSACDALTGARVLLALGRFDEARQRLSATPLDPPSALSRVSLLAIAASPQAALESARAHPATGPLVPWLEAAAREPDAPADDAPSPWTAVAAQHLHPLRPLQAALTPSGALQVRLEDGRHLLLAAAALAPRFAALPDAGLTLPEGLIARALPAPGEAGLAGLAALLAPCAAAGLPHLTDLAAEAAELLEAPQPEDAALAALRHWAAALGAGATLSAPSHADCAAGWLPTLTPPFHLSAPLAGALRVRVHPAAAATFALALAAASAPVATLTGHLLVPTAWRRLLAAQDDGAPRGVDVATLAVVWTLHARASILQSEPLLGPRAWGWIEQLTRTAARALEAIQRGELGAPPTAEAP